MTTSTPPQPKGRPSHRATVAFVMLAAGALIAVALLGASGAFRDSRTMTISAPASTAAAGPAPDASRLDPETLYARAAPSVVDITAQGTTSNPASGPFGGIPPRTQTTATGTGFVLNRAGDVMTAAHVVNGASSVRITLQNGSKYKATVLGKDNSTDVAVLRIDSPPAGLRPIALGSSASLTVGQPVAVIGDPFGLDRSLSTGLVSGLDRTIQAPSGFTVAHAIQTDAALNPGNSGGPVLDVNGGVIGIADQIATNGAEQNAGVGFAVPIDIARSEVTALGRGQAIKHAYLGIATASAPGQTAGALVAQVAPTGPAAAAGLRAGDIVTRIGGVRITNANGLISVISSARPGTKERITVKRGSATTTLTATLGTQPARGASVGG